MDGAVIGLFTLGIKLADLVIAGAFSTGRPAGSATLPFNSVTDTISLAFPGRFAGRGAAFSGTSFLSALTVLIAFLGRAYGWLGTSDLTGETKSTARLRACGVCFSSVFS